MNHNDNSHDGIQIIYKFLTGYPERPTLGDAALRYGLIVHVRLAIRPASQAFFSEVLLLRPNA